MNSGAADHQLRRSDYALLCVFSLVLFGYSLFGGRVLTLHEARLPQAAREMMADGDWIVPKCGGRPWLERPPLPHWITIGVASIFGRCDEAWIVRIPPTLMGLACVLLTGWIAAGWFGRAIGVLSGLILATSCEFLRYAWLAEEDVFLAAIVLAVIALFVQLEFFRAPRPAVERNGFFGGRPLPVLVFFAVLGATNLVKGLFFGMAVSLVPIAAFLVGTADWQRMRRYLWCWGWLVCAALAVSWIVAVSLRYPDMLQIWFGDVENRTDGSSRTAPFWYYGVNLLWLLAPWPVAAAVGLLSTRSAAVENRTSAQRFLWCWALLPVLFLSIPSHKHHHYLVPCLAPWAILSAVGAVRIWRHIATWPAWSRSPWLPVIGIGVPGVIAVAVVGDKIPGPAWLPTLLYVVIPLSLYVFSRALSHPDGRWATGLLFGLLASAYLAGYSYTGAYLDKYREDTRFLSEVKATIGPDQPVYVNADGAILNTFRNLFYLGENARTLHNLTFLHDEQIRERDVYVVSRYEHVDELKSYGETRLVAESRFHQRDASPETRWVLFQVRLRDDLPKLPNNVTYTALQVMERAPGPFLK